MAECNRRADGEDIKNCMILLFGGHDKIVLPAQNNWERSQLNIIYHMYSIAFLYYLH